MKNTAALLIEVSDIIEEAKAASYNLGLQKGIDALKKIASVTPQSLKSATKEDLIRWLQREIDALEKGYQK